MIRSMTGIILLFVMLVRPIHGMAAERTASSAGIGEEEVVSINLLKSVGNERTKERETCPMLNMELISSQTMHDREVYPTLVRGATKAPESKTFTDYERCNEVTYTRYHETVDGGSRWHVIKRVMYDCEEMIGGKLHIVSKEQVRLKPAAADGNVDTVWADRKYFKCIERSSQVSDSEASVVETSDLGSFGPLSAFRFDKSPDVVDVGTPVLSNGYVMVSGTTLRALDLLTVKYLQILGFNPNVKNPTKKEIQDTTLPETADAEEEFHKAKEYLLKRQFQDEDGPILPSIIHDPQSFGQEDVIWNCIDHTDLKPNVLALQKECNKKKKRSDSFIRVLRIPNDPFFDESISNVSSSEEDQAQDQDQTPSRRRIEMISPDPCGMFIEARKMTTRTDFSAAQKQAAQRSFKVSQFACVQHLCPCMSPRKNEPISAELEGLRPPKEESLSTLSYCYVTDAQSSLVSTDADGSVDETSVSSTPTGQDGCVGVLRETMTPELANAFFHQETGSMKWIRKCSHSAEDYQDEQFTGFFGFFKNIGRYVIRRWIFEDRHCVPV